MKRQIIRVHAACVPIGIGAGRPDTERNRGDRRQSIENVFGDERPPSTRCLVFRLEAGCRRHERSSTTLSPRVMRPTVSEDVPVGTAASCRTVGMAIGRAADNGSNALRRVGSETEWTGSLINRFISRLGARDRTALFILRWTGAYNQHLSEDGWCRDQNWNDANGYWEFSCF